MESTEHTAGSIPLRLNGFRMTELQFRNRTPKSGFPLKQELRYQVRFLPGKVLQKNRPWNLCEGVLNLHLFDASVVPGTSATCGTSTVPGTSAGAGTAGSNADGFDLSLTFTGLFAYDPACRPSDETAETPQSEAAPRAGSREEASGGEAKASAEEVFRGQLHRLTCDVLYPHAAAMVAALTAQAGLPPLILSKPESSGGVYIIERNRKDAAGPADPGAL